MKILKTAFLVTVFLFSVSCHGNKTSVKTEPCASTNNDKVAQNKEVYDFIQIERRGGGDKLFNLYPTGNKDTLKAEIFRYNFKSIDETRFIVNNADRDSAFSVYYAILENKRAILADSVSKDQSLTGTWVHYYAVKDTTRTEITNKEVKDILIQFEWMLKDAFSE